MHNDPIIRHSDGSINYDVYLTRGRKERSVATHKAITKVAKIAKEAAAAILRLRRSEATSNCESRKPGAPEQAQGETNETNPGAETNPSASGVWLWTAVRAFPKGHVVGSQASESI